MRGEILVIAVDANPALFDRTMKEVLTETDRSKRQATALGLMLEPKLDARETLQMLFAGGGGGGGGRGGGGGGGGSESNLAVSQTFFRDHQAEIMKSMPQDGTSGPFARISGLFTETCDAAQRDTVAEYVKTTFGTLPGGKRTIAQNLEQMDQCIARRKQLDPEIRAWLTGAKLPPAKP